MWESLVQLLTLVADNVHYLNVSVHVDPRDMFMDDPAVLRALIVYLDALDWDSLTHVIPQCPLLKLITLQPYFWNMGRDRSTPWMRQEVSAYLKNRLRVEESSTILVQ